MPSNKRVNADAIIIQYNHSARVKLVNLIALACINTKTFLEMELGGSCVTTLVVERKLLSWKKWETREEDKKQNWAGSTGRERGHRGTGRTAKNRESRRLGQKAGKSCILNLKESTAG